MYGPIGLCCISIKQKQAPVTEHQVNRLFRDFANISKILIFQQDPAFKCFIEFSDTSSFERALRNIDKVPQEFGKVSLYHSKKDSLKNAFEFPVRKGHVSSTGDEEAWAFSKSFDENDSGDDTARQRRGRHSPNQTSDSHNSDGSYENFRAKSPTSITKQADPKLAVLREIDFTHSELPFLKFLPDTDPEADTPESTVLLVENFYLSSKLIKLLQNALGCYGNLVRMVANFPEHRFLAEMENRHQANLVCIYLNKFVFYNTALSIKNTNIASLRQAPSPAPGMEFFQMEDWTQRFRKHLSIKFNPPSKILHFTSIAPRVDQFILFELISQVHEPLKIYKLVKNAGRSDMYLVEFNSITESIEVLAALHNKMIDNKSLKISFSHPEIN